MHHAAVPFEHAHAGFEQRPVTGLRYRSHDRQIAGTRHQQAHVDAVARRCDQRLHVRRDADEVRIGQPQRTLRHRSDQLIEAEDACGVRLRCDDADIDVACRRRILQPQMAQRWAKLLPDVGECLLEFQQGRAAHSDRAVAPYRRLVRGLAEPLGADAQAAKESDRAIGQQQLAVIAIEPSERGLPNWNGL